MCCVCAGYSLVLADGCLSDTGVVGWGFCYGGAGWLGGVLCIYKSRDMTGCENFKSGFHFLLCGACRSAGSTASFAVAAHAEHTGREWVTILSPRHIEKAAEKRSQQLRGNADPRGKSLLPSLTQIRRWAWQHFHFSHLLISYDWALMGFCG